VRIYQQPGETFGVLERDFGLSRITSIAFLYAIIVACEDYRQGSQGQVLNQDVTATAFMSHLQASTSATRDAMEKSLDAWAGKKTRGDRRASMPSLVERVKLAVLLRQWRCFVQRTDMDKLEFFPTHSYPQLLYWHGEDGWLPCTPIRPLELA
jgi:hypothetical protein